MGNAETQCLVLMKKDWQKETYQESFIRLENGLFLIIGLGISKW